MKQLTLLFLSLIVLARAQAQTQKGNDIDGEAASDNSGFSVSMPDVNTLAVGAYLNDGAGSDAGHVRIYEYVSGAWQQKGADIDGEAADDQSSYSVSMPDANTVAIGAPFNDGAGSDAGHVRIYEYVSGAWQQKGLDIDGEAAGNRSGFSVSMPDASTIAIGAILNAGTGVNAGHVRIYEYVNGAWQQKGLDIDGEAIGDQLGFSVSMPDANTVAIGAPQNDAAASNAGHVRVYEYVNGAWQQKGLDMDGEATDDFLGYSVSMPDANTVATGAPNNDATGNNAGHARIYEYVSGAWQQKGADIDGEAADDRAGWSVSMPDASTVAIGARFNDGAGSNSGHVRIYEYVNNAWQQKGADIDGEAGNDWSGQSVSMPDVSTVAIGAPRNDGTAGSAGHVRVYSLTTTSIDQLGEEAATTVELFPNPVKEALQLRLSDIPSQQNLHIRILNTLGQLMYQGQYPAQALLEIQEVATLVPGSYFLHIRQAEEEIILPFVKQ